MKRATITLSDELEAAVTSFQEDQAVPPSPQLGHDRADGAARVSGGAWLPGSGPGAARAPAHTGAAGRG